MNAELKQYNYKFLAQFAWHIYNNYFLFITKLSRLHLIWGSLLCFLLRLRESLLNIWEQLQPHHEQTMDLNRMVKWQWSWIASAETERERRSSEVKNVCVRLYLSVSCVFIHLISDKACLWFLGAWARPLFTPCMHVWVHVCVCVERYYACMC